MHFVDRFSKKCSSVIFHKFRPLVGELFHMDVRTDRHDESKSRVSSEYLQSSHHFSAVNNYLIMRCVMALNRQHMSHSFSSHGGGFISMTGLRVKKMLRNWVNLCFRIKKYLYMCVCVCVGGCVNNQKLAVYATFRQGSAFQNHRRITEYTLLCVHVLRMYPVSDADLPLTFLSFSTTNPFDVNTGFDWLLSALVPFKIYILPCLSCWL